MVKSFLKETSHFCKYLKEQFHLKIIRLDTSSLSFPNLFYLFKFFSEYNKFRALGGKVDSRYAVLHDYNSNAGLAQGHYFHQDLLVASYIYKMNPIKHIDIGSRIDGFVAHIASFREISVMDVRTLDSSSLHNISFIQADLMVDASVLNISSDSISCLHAIEHFGLGRYGDPIDPLGHIKGFKNILKMLSNDGILYISFPIGLMSKVHFNAHRIFNPSDIFSWPTEGCDLQLLKFDFVDDEGDLHQNIGIDDVPSHTTYGCGIYTFKKINHQKFV
jgi:hypothetical protein